MNSRRLIVIGTLALAALPTGALVVEDVVAGEQIGEAFATVTPLKVGDGQVVFAGPQESPEHHMTILKIPGESATPYPIKEGGWMSQPVPYTAGMEITMIAQDKGGRELFRLEDAIKPYAGGLRPMLGPSWQGYGPQVD